VTAGELLGLVAALEGAPPPPGAHLDRVGAGDLVDKPIGGMSLG